MKKSTLSLLLLPFLSFAQSFSWLRTPSINLNLNPDYVGYVTAADASGNVYFAGFKDDAFSYNTIMGNQYFNKYNASGGLLFSKTLSGHADVRNLVTDSDGNLIMAVAYVGTFVVDGLSIDTNSQDIRSILLKFDANGNLLWHFELGNDDQSPAFQLSAIATDSENNVYAGYYDFLDSSVMKFSPSGDLLLTIPQPHVRALTSMSVDNAGNIYTAGSCAESNATYHDVIVQPPFLYNTYVAKYNPEGNFQWVKYVEDVTCPTPEVRAFSPDAVYFSSALSGPFAFDSIAAEGPVDNFGFADMFIARLNAAGNYQWVREVPGAGQLMEGNRNFIDVDSDDNLYFAGRMRGTIHWNDHVVSASTPGFSNDAIFLKYSPDGEMMSAVTAGGTSEDRFDSVAVSSDGGVYLSGMVAGNVAFGGITHEGDEFSSYPFVTKLQDVLGTVAPKANDAVKIYPNPVKDHFYISGTKESFTGAVYNILGMNVRDFSTASGSGVYVGDLSKGVYLIRVGTVKKKVIIQ